MREIVRDEASQPVKNRHVNPSLNIDMTQWKSNNNSLYAAARVATGGVDGGPCFRLTRTSVALPAPSAASGSIDTSFVSIIPGEIVQCSISVSPTVANRRLLMYMIFLDSNGTSIASNQGQVQVDIPVGSFTRVSTLARVVPAGASFMGLTWRVDATDGDTAQQGEETFFDQLFIGNTHTQYADGNSPGWKWLGTPGASESVGYPWALDSRIVRQKITNVVRNPAPVATGAAAYPGWTSVGGTTTRDTTVGALQAVSNGTTSNRVSPIALIDRQPAGTYTVSFDARLGPDPKFTTLRVIFYDSVAGVGRSGGAALTLPPRDDFARRSHTAAVDGPWDRLYIEFRNDATTPVAVVTGDIGGWVRRLAVMAGSEAPYADGTYPEWIWTGAANNSTSTGFPYTLESIAGTPLASITTPNTSSSSLGLGTHEGRTLYTVFDVIDIQSNLPSYATIGNLLSPSIGRIGIRATGTGTANLEARFQPLDGTPYFAPRTGVRTPGRHVAAATLAEGLTSMSFTLDNLSTFTNSSILAGSGQDIDARLWLGNVTASDRPVIALAYRGEHDDATRKRVMAWLARQYGATIPTGY